MRYLMIVISTILIASCSTVEYKKSPVIIPAAPYSGTVRLASIVQCPVPVQREVYLHLKSRDDYIETLLAVIKVHNEGSNE